MSNHDLDRLGSQLVTDAARLVRAVRRGVDLPAGLRVLSILDGQGPLGVTQLADADRCSQPTMSGLVNALADRGWVRRASHPDDARSSLVELTTDGRRALAGFRRKTGRLVAERLTAAGRHSPADVALAVSVLRDALDTPSTEPREGIQ